MNLLLVPALLVFLNQPAAPGMHELTLHVSDAGDVLYDVAIPKDYDPLERITRQLEQMGRPVRFEALRDPGHFEMGGYVDALRRAGRWIAERWNRQVP